MIQTNFPYTAGRLLVIAALTLLLTACGFHIRGATPLPFDSLYTNINLNSEFGARLERAIRANSPATRIVTQRSEADVFLRQIEDSEDLRQLSLDADGRVEEYELRLRFTFELVDRNGERLLEPTTLESLRELPYSENIVQAKESEIQRNFNDMRDLLIHRIMSRISSPEVRAAYARSNENAVSGGAAAHPAGKSGAGH
ncbi:LPS assembly lipoprotein LptE [Castellaniella sp.]|uniref:LPS-assembly lipoprotein LptE n=1 Tax=Castellaniella sp. TaxID=1955812 RepID=UPI00355FCA5F